MKNVKQCMCQRAFFGYFLFNALFAIGFNFPILRMGEDDSMAAYCIFASVLAF